VLKLHEAWFEVARTLTEQGGYICHVIDDMSKHEEISPEVEAEMQVRLNAERRRLGKSVSDMDALGLWPLDVAGRISRIQFCTKEIKRLAKAAKKGK